MKRTNGTDHTIIKKETLEEKLQRVYGKKQVNEKRSNSPFSSIISEQDYDDGFYFETSSPTDYDDEIYND